MAILDADDATEALVLEMGMRGPGEIARLCEIGRPTIGVVTVVAAAHTERVGGLDGVARAKAELDRRAAGRRHRRPQRRRPPRGGDGGAGAGSRR